MEKFMNNPHLGSKWDDEFEKSMFTPEELAESDLRVAINGEFIKARRKKHITQQEFEKLSSVRQPIISRMEKGSANTKLKTVLKVLASLGKTLAVVPIKKLEQQTGL